MKKFGVFMLALLVAASGTFAQSAAPFIICNVIVLLLVTLIPQISLWLPGLAG
jgi:TRAP-type C4-dicarboxylate transport system permease large subunit